jgi:hypothetical protein
MDATSHGCRGRVLGRGTSRCRGQYSPLPPARPPFPVAGAGRAGAGRFFSFRWGKWSPAERPEDLAPIGCFGVVKPEGDHGHNNRRQPHHMDAFHGGGAVIF